jgi:hypothetical protein
MKVDLQELKNGLEQQIQQLEQRKALLHEQISHVEAVQRIVSGLSEDANHEENNATQTPNVGATGEGEGKAWFKRA